MIVESGDTAASRQMRDSGVRLEHGPRVFLCNSRVSGGGGSRELPDAPLLSGCPRRQACEGPRNKQ